MILEFKQSLPAGYVPVSAYGVSAETEPPDAVGAEAGGGRVSLHGGSLGTSEKLRERVTEK